MDSDRDTLAGGLPHSEIPGSPIARISPGLFAACCVLHRLSVPRHPPDALCLLASPAPSGKPRPGHGTFHEDTSRTRPTAISTAAAARPAGECVLLPSVPIPTALGAAWRRPKVEVIGFEPTPSCLQSRRSPG